MNLLYSYENKTPTFCFSNLFKLTFYFVSILIVLNFVFILLATLTMKTIATFVFEEIKKLRFILHILKLRIREIYYFLIIKVD